MGTFAGTMTNLVGGKEGVKWCNALKMNGGGAGTRTPDTGIMIPLLYQLSYTAPRKF